jgi:C4-dicarboxylate transporter, DctQ subunit
MSSATAQRSGARSVERVAAAVENIAAVVFAVVTLLTFVSAVSRFVFDYPIPDAFDVGRLLLGVMVFWGLASVAFRNTHIRVDLLWEFSGPRTRKAMDLLAGLLTTIAFIALCWYQFGKFLEIYQSGEVTFDLRLSVWPLYLAVWLGTLGMAVMSTLHLVSVLFGIEPAEPGIPVPQFID